MVRSVRNPKPGTYATPRSCFWKPPRSCVCKAERAEVLTKALVVCSQRWIKSLCVKARAACWALLGDLDPMDEPTTDKRMALSIVRDLIRLHDPDLEHAGALKQPPEPRPKKTGDA